MPELRELEPLTRFVTEIRVGTAQLGHGDFTRIAGNDFTLLGDAAGFADPATGEGIRNALGSGELLATAWVGDGTFASYPALARRAFEREFGVSRIVLESDTTLGGLASGVHSATTYALVATMADAINEHDGSVASLLRRFWRTRRTVGREHRRAGRDGRTPVPCGCFGSHRTPRGIIPSGGAAACAA